MNYGWCNPGVREFRMNPGDLVGWYSYDYDDFDRGTTINDVGIILGGSWNEGVFRVLFSRSGVRSARVGTIKRIGLRR